MNLLEKCKLCNFDEKTAKAFLRKNRENAVIIKPYVDDDAKIDYTIGNAEVYRCDGKQLILWSINYCCYHHIHFDKLNKISNLYLCETRNEAKKLYSEWRKLPSTIDKQKKAIENKISEHEKIILELKEKLSKI